MTKAAIAEENADLQSATQSPVRDEAVKSFTRKEIKPLTTLRFFAAFAVVVSHASDSFACWHGLANTYIVGQAVTFFFVLSGFILTYNYFNLSGSRAALSFYVARLARIWPAHICSLILLLMLIPEVFKLKSADLPLFLCNLFLLQSWIPSWHVFFSYNASAWSISSEMFFYLCFPLLLWGMNKRWYLPMAISSTVLGILICYANFVHLPEYDPLRLSNQGLLYINPLSSIFNFCAGMTAAVLWRDCFSRINLNKAVATLLELGILAGVCIINVLSSNMRYACQPWAGDAGAYWVQNSGPAVLGFALLITIFAMDKGWISKLFANPALVLLGELSFGIYMLHGVLITFLGVNFPQEQSLQACLVFLVTLFVSAHLMFEIVEKPMRKLIMKSGHALIDSWQSKLKKAAASRCDSVETNKSSVNTQLLRRRTFLTLEALAFASFIYFTMPTIHQLTAADASALASKASVRNIALPPYLICRSASAQLSAEKVSLSLVWEALRAETVNFTVTVIALDQSGQQLSSTTYTQDGRRQNVKGGSSWLDSVSLPTGGKAVPATVAVTVLRNKHEVLRSSSASCNVSFTVPVNSSSESRF